MNCFSVYLLVSFQKTDEKYEYLAKFREYNTLTLMINLILNAPNKNTQ